MDRFNIVVLLSAFLIASIVIVAQDNDNKPFKFSHKQHMAEEMVCADCHVGVEESTSGMDNLMPDKAVCLDCHEGEEIGNFDLVIAVESYSKKFSHQQHLAADNDCAKCHYEVSQKEEAFPYVLPTMVECMSCHEQQAVSVGCATCHLPFENLKPISHTVNFIHNHADIARMDAMEISADMSCMTCHDQQYCQDCHEGENLDQFTHPLNYEFTHALEAQINAKDCATCHTERTFCTSCHVANQVLPHSHSVGWVNNFPGDGGRHAIEARNDLAACISCHETDAPVICQTCHGN